MSLESILATTRKWALGTTTALGMLFSTYAHGQKAAQGTIIEWKDKYVTEQITDSATQAPIQGTTINYRLLDTDGAPAQALTGYTFTTNEQGTDAQNILVRNEKPDAINTPKANDYGLAISTHGEIAAHMNGRIKQISILNILGQYQQQYNIQDDDGQEKIQADIERLAPGTYIAIAQDEKGAREILKFIKNNNQPEGWQTNNTNFNPTQQYERTNNKKAATTEEEITTRYERTINAQGYKEKIDTIHYKYNNAADTTITTKIAKIPAQEYNRQVTIHLTPNKTGKHIPDGTTITLDELTTTTEGDSAMFNYKTTKPNEEKELLIRGVEGYEDLQARITIDEENERATQTIEAKEFYAPINTHVADQDQGDAAGASMEIYGQQAFADEQGKATFRIKLETDQYNRFTPYNKTLKVSRGVSEHDFDTKEQDVKMDTTNQSIDQVVQFINEFYLHSNNSTPGMSVKIWQGGQPTSQTTSDEQGNYQTPKIKSTQLTITPDSVTYDKQDMIPKKTTPTLHDGGDKADIILEAEPVNNTYREKAVFANQTADEYDDGLVFIIKTLKDGAEHATNVEAAQHVQELELTGAYEPTDSIEAYYTSTSAASKGKEANILTITRSYEQPTASNGSRNNKLKTTIGDLFNQEPDTTWILSMSTDLYNDVAFKTHVAGAAEWVHSENGKRTMNINGITRSVDISEGTYADDLTNDEIQAIRDRAALFNQDFWNRATGLKILQVKYHETTTYPTAAGNINYYFDRTEPQPGNNHLLKETTRAYTWDYGTGHVPHGTREYIGQFTGETTQATSWIFDYNDTVGDVVGTNEDGTPYIKKENVLIIPFTYVGGKGPINE